MKLKWIEQNFKYDGTQLRSLYAYLEHGILGDSIVGWRGACDVSFDHMVDGEDLLAKSTISGSDMLHFIVEKFDVQLFSAVTLQRLMASMVQGILLDEAPELVRKGDDLYWGNKKLNISIATVTPSSTLIHFALNVSNEGTPVETASLEDFGIDPTGFAHEFMEKICAEVTSITSATQKVKWVK